MLTALDLAGIPLEAKDRTRRPPDRARRRPRRLQPRADRGLHRLRGHRRRRAGRPGDDRDHPRLEGRGPARAAARRSSSASRRPAASTCPRFYDVEYLPDGRIARVVPNRSGVPWRVSKHTVMDLDEWPYPKQPLVPLAETVHERMSVEIFRGCTRGCRFCQAGMITRPVRERSITGIGDMVEKGLKATGFEEVGLLSLSSADHTRDRRHRQGPRRPVRGGQDRPVPAVDPRRRLQRRPGQRADPQRPPLRPDLRPRGRLRAHAQGHQQDGLRRGPDPDRLHRVRQRLAPGEAVLHVRPADRDRRGRAPDRRHGGQGHRRGPRGLRPERHPLHGLHRRLRPQAAHPVPVGAAAVAPRRRTPAWRSCATRSAATRSTAAPSASATTTASPASSRACSRAATAASARSSAPSTRTAAASTAGASTSRYDRWMECAEKTLPAFGVDVDWYTTRERTYEEVLPWDHLDSGLDKDWLWEDWQDALDETEVEDCRWTPCFDCGVCPQMDTRHPDRPDRQEAAAADGRQVAPARTPRSARPSAPCGAGPRRAPAQ